MNNKRGEFYSPFLIFIKEDTIGYYVGNVDSLNPSIYSKDIVDMIKSDYNKIIDMINKYENKIGELEGKISEINATEKPLVFYEE